MYSFLFITTGAIAVTSLSPHIHNHFLLIVTKYLTTPYIFPLFDMSHFG